MHGRGPERLVAVALLAAILLGVGAFALRSDLRGVERPSTASPDWSLTVAARGQPGGEATPSQRLGDTTPTTTPAAPPTPTSVAPPPPPPSTTTTPAPLPPPPPPPTTAPPTTAAPTTLPPTTVPPSTTAPPSEHSTHTNDPSAEGVIRRQLTERRAEIGQPDFVSEMSLDDEARRWSREMATSVGLAHNPNSLNYTYSHCANCSGASENVGRGPYASGIFRAFLESPSHRAAIDRAGPGIVGIGAWRAPSGKLYITMMFGYH